MNIELFTTSHLADAADLVYKNYCEEASQVTALPLQIMQHLNNLIEGW